MTTIIYSTFTHKKCVSPKHTNVSGKQSKVAALQLGMSTLHARIRFMEYLLHLSYNIGFKSWRTNADTRAMKEKAKTCIQNNFKERLGNSVDMVKQGTGNTNSGNTSGRFFSNISVTSEILKLTKD
jgi:hypothetical protein